MRISNIACVLAIGLVTGACATAVPVVDYYETDSQSLRRFQAMEVLDESAAQDSNLKSIAVVEGIYCDKGGSTVYIGDPLAEAQAVDQVKLKAAKKGATHIRALACVVRVEGDFTNNCVSTVVCTAESLGPKN